jgi:hypothetical protein
MNGVAICETKRAAKNCTRFSLIVFARSYP